MKLLFWGAALVLLDADVTLGTAVFDLFPDFLGLMLLRRGMERFAGECAEFDRGRHFAFGLELAAMILYGARLLSTTPVSRVTVGILLLVLRACFLVLLYFTVRGTLRLASERGADIRSEQIRGLFPVLAVLQPICLLVTWIPLFGSVSRIASAVFALCFLAAFRSCTKIH